MLADSRKWACCAFPLVTGTHSPCVPWPVFPLSRFARIALLDSPCLCVLPSPPCRNPCVHCCPPPGIRQVFARVRALVALFVEELHPLFCNQLHFTTHRMPRVWVSLVLRKLFCNSHPPFTEITTLSEFARMPVADIEQRDFFQGSQSLSMLARPIAVWRAIGIVVMVFHWIGSNDTGCCCMECGSISRGAVRHNPSGSRRSMPGLSGNIRSLS